MAHSPGPWAFDEDNLPYGQIDILCDGVPFANVMNVEDFPCLDEEDFDHVNEQAIADARLMAAAPELLAALEEHMRRCVAAYDNEDGFWVCAFCERELQEDEKCTAEDCMGVKARAAIKKAKGL